MVANSVFHILLKKVQILVQKMPTEFLFFFLTNRIPLHESAHNGTLSIFKVLLDAGSDKDALDDILIC